MKQDVHGWICIDKDLGVSSSSIVRKIKRLYDFDKVGHGGTLDPMATGVLPIAIGEATKTVSYVMYSPKTYEFTIKFGESRDTQDSEGEVVDLLDYLPSQQEILSSLNLFIGEIDQTPPKYSAIKISGQRAYKLARAGKTFEIPVRKVKIYSLQLLKYDSSLKEAIFIAKVSKGTYIRSLAVSIATSTNSLAYVKSLRRTNIASMAVEENSLLKLAMLYNDNNLLFRELVSIEQSLKAVKEVIISKSIAIDLLHGKKLPLSAFNIEEQVKSFKPQTLKATCNGVVISILKVEDNIVKVVRNFNHGKVI